uniref:DUF834 domain-containing protein n=1 Tax=Oryza rufipogon TaxID=4529 RepID=A0A0E0RJC4_ORYRU
MAQGKARRGPGLSVARLVFSFLRLLLPPNRAGAAGETRRARQGRPRATRRRLGKGAARLRRSPTGCHGAGRRGGEWHSMAAMAGHGWLGARAMGRVSDQIVRWRGGAPGWLVHGELTGGGTAAEPARLRLLIGEIKGGSSFYGTRRGQRSEDLPRDGGMMKFDVAAVE